MFSAHMCQLASMNAPITFPHCTHQDVPLLRGRVCSSAFLNLNWLYNQQSVQK